MIEALAAEKVAFIEVMGHSHVNQGMTSISGRIMGLMLFEGRAFSFSELATTLAVSRGSISTNTQMLIERHMIIRRKSETSRADLYLVQDDLYGKILVPVVESMRATASNVRSISVKLPLDSDVQIRLENYATFHEAVAESIENTIKLRLKKEI